MLQRKRKDLKLRNEGRGGEIKRDREVSEGMHFYFYELRAINKTFRGAEKKDKNDKRKDLHFK